MYTTINYENKTKPEIEALKDIANWFGGKRQRAQKEILFLQHYGNIPPKFETFVFWCSFAGIEGYPVRVWYKHIWPSAEIDLSIVEK